MGGSGLTLDQLAADINARLKKGDDHFISATQHLLEAKTRVEAGEDGRNWKDWCAVSIRIPWKEIRKRLGDAEARSLISREVVQQLGAGRNTDARTSIPTSHPKKAKAGAKRGQPKGAAAKAAEKLGINKSTVTRALRSRSEPMLRAKPLSRNGGPFKKKQETLDDRLNNAFDDIVGPYGFIKEPDHYWDEPGLAFSEYDKNQVESWLKHLDRIATFFSDTAQHVRAQLAAIETGRSVPKRANTSQPVSIIKSDANNITKTLETLLSQVEKAVAKFVRDHPGASTELKNTLWNTLNITAEMLTTISETLR